MRRVENLPRVFEERLFLPPHPSLVAHVGTEMVYLPVIADGKMVGEQFPVDANQAVFAEEAIGRTVVHELRQVVVGVRTLGDEIGDGIDVIKLLEVIASVIAGEAYQQRQSESIKAVVLRGLR